MKAQRTGLTCFICNTLIWSLYSHDFNVCNCEWGIHQFIDGGGEYTRIGYIAANTYTTNLLKFAKEDGDLFLAGRINYFDLLSPSDYFDYLAAQRKNGVIK